jgi:uncharacterized protein YukE
MMLEELILPLRTDNALFKAGIAAAAAGVAALVAGMGLAIKATFKWADELDSIQDIMGGTNKTAAALNFTLRKSGTDTERLTKGMTILSKGLVKADGSLDTTGKSLKAWGVNVLDANGMLKDQTALIGDISAKYATFSTQQEKVNFLTETFGRSGAELIDFFDTLAAEGGIDAVAAKVERLGLAIDPNRYEQFNRNLEELKLVGLGLAVGFTEKVMPAIEGFLELISDPKLTVADFATKADEFIGGLIDDVATSIDTWVSGGGPEELSKKIVSWVENLGDDEDSKSKILTGAGHLVSAIVEAIGGIDFSAIATAIDLKTAEKIGEHDWVASGEAFRTGFLNMWNGSWDANMLAGAPPIDATPTGMAIKGAVEDFILGAFGPETLSTIQNWSFDANAIIANWSFDADAIIANWAAGVVTKVQTWAVGVVATISTWGANMVASMNTAITTLKSNIQNKLDEISQVWNQKAQSWINQAVQSLNAAKQRILDEVTKIKTAINRILDQIKSSITLNFNIPDWVQNIIDGGGGGGSGSGTTNPGVGERPGNRRRASGGPVIAGQSYSVAEFFRPERFTPSVNGRIDPIANKQSSFEIDYNRLGSIIANQVVKAMNSA